MNNKVDIFIDIFKEESPKYYASKPNYKYLTLMELKERKIGEILIGKDKNSLPR